MRVRNRKGATELLEANPQYVILNPAEAKGKWHEILGISTLFILKWEVGKVRLFQKWQKLIQKLTISELIFKNLF